MGLRKIVERKLSIFALLLTLASHVSAKTPGEEPWSDHSKRVEIDKTNQVLRAYEGDRLVFKAISAPADTTAARPTGVFRPAKNIACTTRDFTITHRCRSVSR